MAQQQSHEIRQSPGLWMYISSAALLVLILVSIAAAPKASLNSVPPRPPRELRGAWIATVANLDWPSKPGLSTADQKAELTALLDKAVQMKLNMLILQVRPGCDAFYASTLEPWSEFLTGRMGQAPEPFYDPLTFAVDEAHRRGLELHAWFNPFRVRAPNPKTGAATNYISRQFPQWVRSYGSQLWLDPGLKVVQDHTTRVILDVVKRYDLDGVHLDDYFYPYPEKNAAGQLLDFPDEASWQQYLASGGKLSRPDWRRKNIDDFIEGLYRRIKAEKRWVKFGISPFGIWRPGFPKQVKKGLDSYQYLYADSRKWLVNGWADYFAPQLYWQMEGVDHSYPALLDWWISQNTKARHLWPGSDTTKVGGLWTSSEIVKQVRLTRKHTRATGNLLWNISSLVRTNHGLAEVMARDLYSQPALVPASPWLNERPLGKPKVEIQSVSGSKSPRAAWTPAPTDKDVWLWLCQTRIRGKWTAAILPQHQTSLPLPVRSSPGFPDLIAVTAVDRCGVAGPTTVLQTKPLLASAAENKRLAFAAKTLSQQRSPVPPGP